MRGIQFTCQGDLKFDNRYGAEGEEEAKRQRKWEQRSNVWAEKVASWEEQKREARLQKVRIRLPSVRNQHSFAQLGKLCTSSASCELCPLQFLRGRSNLRSPTVIIR